MINQCAACGIELPEGNMICRECGERSHHMTLAEYQTRALRTATTGRTMIEWLTNAALGLTGEAGEVADLVKKCAFQGHEIDRRKLAEELGDVLWYIALGAEAIGVTLEEIARENIDKLWDRYPQGFDSVRSRRRES